MEPDAGPKSEACAVSLEQAAKRGFGNLASARGCEEKLQPAKGPSEEEWQCCAVCFCDFDDENPRASEVDAKRHGIVFGCSHAVAFHLSCLRLEARQDRPFQCPLCRAKFGFSIRCICGQRLERRRSSDRLLYGGGGVLCDHCCKDVPPNQRIYHCPMGKCKEHPDGYDICFQCTGRRLRPSPVRRRQSQSTRAADRAAALSQAGQASGLEHSQLGAAAAVDSMEVVRSSVSRGARPIGPASGASAISQALASITYGSQALQQSSSRRSVALPRGHTGSQGPLLIGRQAGPGSRAGQPADGGSAATPPAVRRDGPSVRRRPSAQHLQVGMWLGGVAGSAARWGQRSEAAL